MYFPLNGAFLQVFNDKPDVWCESLEAMKRLDMNLAIVQTEAYLDDNDEPTNSINEDRLKRALLCADNLDMKVWIGLVHPTSCDSDRTCANNKDFIDRLICESIYSVDRILKKWGEYSSFDGFYLSYEGWTPTDSNELGFIANYLTEVSRYCKCKSKGKNLQIATCPFINQTKPDFANITEQVYKSILPGTELTVMMLQDGVGAKNIPFDTVQVYMRAMKNACDQAGIEMWANVESFKGSVSTTFESLQKQIVAANEVTNKLVTYEFANFWMEQSGRAGAAELHSAYYNEYK